MDYELSLDPRTICRCCLSEHATMKTIFCNEIVNGAIQPFPKVFERVVGFKATKDDGFPERICAPCRQTITESFVLRQKNESNRRLLCDILSIQPNDEIDAAPKVPKTFASASSQTDSEPSKAQQTNGTQTDSQKTSTRSASMQTDVRRSVALGTQTEATPAVRHCESHTQTDEQSPFEHESPAVKDLPPTDEADDIEHEQMLDDIDEDAACKSQPIDELLLDLHGIDYDATDAEMAPEAIEYLLDEDQMPPPVDRLRSPAVKTERHGDTSSDDELDGLIPDGISIAPTDDLDAESSVAIESLAGDNYEVYVCSECDLEFVAMADLIGHQHTGCLPADERTAAKAPAAALRPNRKRKRTARDSRTCTLCSFVARDEREMGAHLHDHKRWLPLLLNSIYYFRCASCRLVFLSADDLDEHGASCSSAAERSALATDDDDADDAYTDYQYLDDEWLSIAYDGQLDLNNPALLNVADRLCSVRLLPGDRRRFECDRCDAFECDTASELLQHYPGEHFGADGEPSSAFSGSFRHEHKCGYCGRAFRTISSALAHVFFHEKQFHCPYETCEAKYRRYGQLNMHMDREHPLYGSSAYECSYCQQQFGAFAEYRTHLQVECTERHHACVDCDKRFFSQHYLDVHRRYHHKSRRYRCSYCDKSFTQRGDVHIHERIHTGQRPFKCDRCDKTFRSISNRNDHLATHDSTPRFECNVCHTQFKSSRILRGHMRIHSKDNRLKCKFCAKEFYRPYHLRKHMLVHSHAMAKSTAE